MRKLFTFVLLTSGFALSIGACVKQDHSYGYGYQASPYNNRQAQQGYSYQSNYGYQAQPGYGYEDYGYQAQPSYGYNHGYHQAERPTSGYRHGYFHQAPAYGYGNQQIYQEQNFAQPRGYEVESGFRQEQIQQDARINPNFEGADNQNFNSSASRGDLKAQNSPSYHYGTNHGATQETTNQGNANTNTNASTDTTTRNR